MLHVSGTPCALGWWACRVRRGPPQRAGARAPPVWRTQEVVLYLGATGDSVPSPGEGDVYTSPGAWLWGSLTVPGALPCVQVQLLQVRARVTQTPPTPPPQSVMPRCPCSPWSGCGLPIWQDTVAFSLAFRGWQGMGRGEASTPRMRGSDPWRIFTEHFCVGGCGPWG